MTDEPTTKPGDYADVIDFNVNVSEGYGQTDEKKIGPYGTVLLLEVMILECSKDPKKGRKMIGK